MIQYLRRFTIRQRLWLILALVLLASPAMTLIPITYTSTLFENNQKDLTRIQVETAREIVAYHHSLETSGVLTRVEAKKFALEALEAASLDNRNYFYVYHSANFIVMHPFLKQQSYPDEPASVVPESRKRFLASLNQVVAEMNWTGDGLASVDFIQEEHPKTLTGFFNYYLYVAPSGNAMLARVGDPNLPPEAELKIGYGSYYEPWEWVIFGGVFLDDSQLIYQALLRQMLLPGVLALVGLVLFTLVISRSITAPLSETVEQLENIDSTESWDEALNEIDTDEIGSLAKSFNKMFHRLKLHVEEERNLEEQLRQAQKLEAVGQLTGGIAHDFNNLLTIVQGNIELARDEQDPAAREKLLESAISASDRGALLVDRLLVYSRKQSLAPIVINLNELLDGTRFLLERSIGENIDFVIEEQPDLWLCEIDRAQMENCLVNLAINARDAMAMGGTLTVKTENITLGDDHPATDKLAPGDYIALTVSDTGSGINPELLDRVFEPFFTTKLPGQGSGLGLSMVYGFVAQSQGDMDIQSTPGEGTSVVLYLPRVHGESSSALDLSDSVCVLGHGETILVLEDDDDLRLTSQKLLEGLNFKTLTAANTEEALNHIAQREDIALLMTDMVLSEHRTGVSMAELARQQRPDIPVLFVSGYSDHPAFQQGDIRAGVNFLQKPFTKSGLSQMLARLLA